MWQQSTGRIKEGKKTTLYFEEKMRGNGDHQEEGMQRVQRVTQDVELSHKLTDKDT